ncbi:MAG: YhcH/YjgK/YiaL family protein [Humidesulfovibrio sp.]|nr:YhcH/YjgK/YiaL family protein [Humidesulfovibrio sp.]
MILDALANWPLYSALPAWQQAFSFLTGLQPGVAPGEYPIEGRDIYAIVFDCTTKALLDTTLEAHQVYADLHLPLSGPEVHARFLKADLEETVPYDPKKDAAQYRHPDRFTALFTLHPGQFALYLPHEAHLSQGKTDPRPQALRKVVVKLRADLLHP